MEKQKDMEPIEEEITFEFFSDDEENTEYSNEFDSEDAGEERVLKVRLDKWLWAARFFKTRAVARAAVEKGRVFYNGERSKPSREIEIGATLQIRHGRFEKTVEVKGLSTRRRSTEEALQLFEILEENEDIGGGRGQDEMRWQPDFNKQRPLSPAPNRHTPLSPYNAAAYNPNYNANPYHPYQNGRGRHQQGQGANRYQSQQQSYNNPYHQEQHGYHQQQQQNYHQRQQHNPMQEQAHRPENPPNYPRRGHQNSPQDNMLGEQPRERRAIRFLRRSFGRNDQQPPYLDKPQHQEAGTKKFREGNQIVESLELETFE